MSRVNIGRCLRGWLYLRFVRNVIIIISFLFIVYYLISPYALRLWFPYYHRDVVEFYAAQYDLDPLFVASIIRVESKFNSQAISKMGAKGLMQLMPETARWISEQTNIQFNENKLFEPEYNINLGCWYLANLRSEFNNNINLTLAAYNGGRGNVKKWINQGVWSGEEKDLDKIPFKETRDFVKRVKLTYQMYEKLYGK